ncbi:MAG TPA: amidohydrolase family protein [bacterium]|nr:amidohydrolase family protein [bacterium]
MLVLRNATVVTGDGATVISDGAVVVEGARIVEVRSGSHSRTGGGDTVMDLGGRLIVPGAINSHAHGSVACPLFASGAPPLPFERVLANLDYHLLGGTTTLLNLDGFNLPEEVDRSVRAHPINLRSATIHFPLSFQAANEADGKGLAPAHLAMSVETMLAHGAVAIGEVGGGHTLAGGGQDYMYIPMAVERETGVRLTPHQAAGIKYAVLGRRGQVEAYDRARVEAVLAQVGLAGRMTPERAREIIHSTVLPSFQVALDGLREAGLLAARHRVPVVVHTSAPSEAAIDDAADAAGSFLVSGHTNHSTFTVEESLACARRVKKKGAWIEVCTLDAFGARKLVERPDNMYALLRHDLVDLVATDYAAGRWDNPYVGMAHAVADGVLALPKAVTLVTKNVTAAYPGLAADRGEIAPGKIADLVVCRGRLDQVDLVFVNGTLVCEDGTVRRSAGAEGCT